MFPYVELRKTLTSEGNKIYNCFPLGPVIYCKINFKINFHKKFLYLYLTVMNLQLVPLVMSLKN